MQVELAMFLGQEIIRERLGKDLAVEPILEDQLQAFTIDMRLGTEVAVFSSSGPIVAPGPYPSSFRSVKLGEEISIDPGSGILATLLEYVQLPHDLAGMLFPRSSWWRLGLMSATSIVNPGYRGKITMPLFNMGRTRAIIYPGLRAMHLSVVKITGAPAYHGMRYHPATEIAQTLTRDDLEEIQSVLVHQAERLRARYSPQKALDRSLASVLESSTADKGKALEDFARRIFESVQGLAIIKQNARLSAEEIDLYIRNNISEGFWRIAGTPIVVECKNWSQKVGAREISVLIEKLSSIGPDARTAILIAPSGVTGDEYSDAMLKIREGRQRGLYVLLLGHEDLDELSKGADLSRVIERAYERLLLL